MDTNLSKPQEIGTDREACVLQSMGSQRVRHDLEIEKQQKIIYIYGISDISYIFF